MALTTGFHPNIPEADYHGDRDSLSHSGAKLLLKCPALYRWELDHPTTKRVWDFGSAAHAEVLGIGTEVRTIPASMLASNGAASTKDAKAFIDQARADGAVALKPNEVATIDAMACQLATHTLAARLLSKGEREVSAYALDDPTGVMRRCRFDNLGPAILTDYKTAESADPDAFLRAAFRLGYHQQHAWYLDLARDLGHPAEAFAFIVQEKVPPYLVTVVELPAELVQIGRRRNRLAIERFRDCRDADAWPGYVPAHTFAQPEPQRWMLRDTESEYAS